MNELVRRAIAISISVVSWFGYGPRIGVPMLSTAHQPEATPVRSACSPKMYSGFNVDDGPVSPFRPSESDMRCTPNTDRVRINGIAGIRVPCAFNREVGA